MPYFLISPENFDVNKNVLEENIYIDGKIPVDKTRAKEQHKELCRVLGATAAPVDAPLPDQVFAANAALLLPRLPCKVLILSNFKYPVRAPEVPSFRTMMEARGVRCIPFPKTHVFEGHGECKWFYHGKLLVVGYGFRSTKRSVDVLRMLLQDVYSAWAVEPPVVVGIELASPLFYHMDLAVAECTATTCAAHRHAFVDPGVLERLVDVTWVSTRDPFLLNCVVTPFRVIVHRLKNEKDRTFMKTYFFPRQIVEVDVTEFEKSGGSVNCMVLKF